MVMRISVFCTGQAPLAATSCGLVTLITMTPRFLAVKCHRLASTHPNGIIIPVITVTSKFCGSFSELLGDAGNPFTCSFLVTVNDVSYLWNNPWVSLLASNTQFQYVHSPDPLEPVLWCLPRQYWPVSLSLTPWPLLLQFPVTNLIASLDCPLKPLLGC